MPNEKSCKCSPGGSQLCVKCSAGAKKFDSGKAPLGLIASSFLIGLAKVLAGGAKKYGRHNWRKGMEWSRPYDALLRHLTAWNAGEDLDDEWGLSHLDHAAAELMFLREYVHSQTGTDDRWKTGDKNVKG